MSLENSSRPIHPRVRIGHVHLKVADLERALEFYCGVLGFELTQRYGTQAAFVSAGGYHHHIGLNTWDSVGGSPPPAGTTGLYHLAILYPTRPALAEHYRRKVGPSSLHPPAPWGGVENDREGGLYVSYAPLTLRSGGRARAADVARDRVREPEWRAIVRKYALRSPERLADFVGQGFVYADGQLAYGAKRPPPTSRVSKPRSPKRAPRSPPWKAKHRRSSARSRPRAAIRVASSTSFALRRVSKPHSPPRSATISTPGPTGAPRAAGGPPIRQRAILRCPPEPERSPNM